MNPEFLPASGASRTVPIGDVVTEAGVTIFDAELRLFAFYDSSQGDADYAEFSAGPEPGLSPEERPVVLIEHALTGDGNAADWWADMVGPNKPIDTTRYLVAARGPPAPVRRTPTARRGALDSLACRSVTWLRRNGSCWSVWASQRSMP